MHEKLHFGGNYAPLIEIKSPMNKTFTEMYCAVINIIIERRQ